MRIVLVLPDAGLSDLNTQHRRNIVLSRMQAAREFWRREAGIELNWHGVTIVHSSEFHTLETERDVRAALDEYALLNVPAIVAVDAVESRVGDVSARTIAPWGFAVDTLMSEPDVYAHEYGHLVIPTMLSHSLKGTHIWGNPTNLMASGEARQGRPLDTLFLTQEQVDGARQTVRERGWD